MDDLIAEVRACKLCEAFLPYAPRPVLSVSATARILIIGQAPGHKVQDSGVPWRDQSGIELRRWLGVSESEFYDNGIFAIMPMGFRFPGIGKSGDLPPRPECAPAWHEPLLKQMDKIELTILIGQYSQKFYLGPHLKSNLTETVRAFREYLPRFIPLVHPSPRNNIWQKRNPWFESEVIPFLRQEIVKLKT